MKRSIAAKIAGAALAILMLAATPGLSAGFERATVPDPEGPPLEAGIWYPSGTPASSQLLGPFQQTVATGGEVAGRGLPLIVVSHSTGGSFADHYDTALALAEAGFVVAAVTHTGDNYRDNSGFARIENRPRHIKALVDYMLASWPRRDLIDPARIGMFGFSAGGFTALVAIGGVPDTTRAAGHCAAYPDEWACRKVKESGGGARAPAVFVHEPRIAAAVIAAPAISYSFTPEGLAGIRVPIQLWRPDSDEMFASAACPACLWRIASQARIPRRAECRPFRLPGALQPPARTCRAGDLPRSRGLRSRGVPSRIQSCRGGLLQGEVAGAAVAASGRPTNATRSMKPWASASSATAIAASSPSARFRSNRISLLLPLPLAGEGRGGGAR
jgi:predicted dienelactone hydrolase